MTKMSLNNHQDIEDILLVDDKPANLRLLSQMLADAGYNVRAVTSGKRALDSIKIAQPNLILLDIKMPEMDGYSVCEHLKKDPQTQHIPVIFISALDDIHDKIKAFQVGGVDYITKPFQIEEVLARTKTHLELQKLQGQLRQANKKFERELMLAGRVQTSFLPTELPEVPRWGLSVKLKPARETSGDFYDVFALPDGKLGITVADVVDKGVGAALFMVLCWSLIRTYAIEFSSRPEQVMKLVNHRIAIDTIGDQFVTVFFGVLDPANGKLIYSNAGHCPPVQWSSHENGRCNELLSTGTVLGIFEEQSWEQKEIQMNSGDVIVIYSDGIPDAQNEQGIFFDKARLLEAICSRGLESAVKIRDGILADVEEHMAGAHQVDDIALLVITRE
jgi:serine phosphatase RsbU (regulator of sigma subunit)